MENKAEIGIFGGTGIYNSAMLEDVEEISVDTPFGRPSDNVTLGKFKERRVAFIPRHGKKHTIQPHKINYRANIWAFKQLGVSRIIAPSAVGSLRTEIEPGHFVLPSQFIDFTKSRTGTFYDKEKVVHISVADPFCPDLQKTTLEAAKNQNITIHQDKTYVCVEGPRFSTKAESKFFKTTGGDIIGMTVSPECQLAREAQMCYVSLSSVTDYDVWAEKPVTAKEVLETLSKNVEKTKNILSVLVEKIPTKRSCMCEKALSEAEF